MHPDSQWKRQLALFAAAVSLFVGLGVLLILFFTSRDRAQTPAPQPSPHPTESPGLSTRSAQPFTSAWATF
jgi:hypothetical protein